MYRLESVLFLCTVHISVLRSRKCCSCAQYTFLITVRKFLLLCTVHISYIPSGKRSVSVHTTHFCCTVWEVLFMCTINISDYRPKSVLFLCTLHISVVRSGMCCSCAQYTFLMYRPEVVLFLCTVYISDAQWYDISLCNRFLVQVLFARSTSLWCYRTEDSSHRCLTCNHIPFSLECAWYQIWCSLPL